MRASSYIDLPQQIKRKQACVNIKNLDNQCFKWVMLSALHPVNRRDSNHRVCKYKKYESELNFTGIDFPVALKDLAKFEQQNNISLMYMVSLEKSGCSTLFLYT